MLGLVRLGLHAGYIRDSVGLGAPFAPRISCEASLDRLTCPDDALCMDNATCKDKEIAKVSTVHAASTAHYSNPNLNKFITVIIIRVTTHAKTNPSPACDLHP